MIDSLSDMLARIRNAILSRKEKVIIPYSTLKFEVAKILEQEGYVKGFSKNHVGAKEILELELKYSEDNSVIAGIEIVSKPGQRIYKSFKELPKVLGGLGVLIVSTPKGVMTGFDAKKQKSGGEILAKIW